MKVTKAILCCNESSDYYRAWPTVYRAWRAKVGIEAHLFFVGPVDSVALKWLRAQTGHHTVTQLPAIEGSATEWQATWALFWGQSTLPPDTVCVTSGIDQAPMGDWIHGVLHEVPDDTYVGFLERDDWTSEVDAPNRNLATAYHIAKASTTCKAMRFEKTWEAEVKKLEASNVWLEYWDTPFVKWGLDETWATYQLQAFKKRGGRVRTMIGHPRFDAGRLDLNASTPPPSIEQEVRAGEGHYYETIFPKPFLAHQADVDYALSLTPDRYLQKTSILEPGAKVGPRTKIWHNAHICAGAQIGADCTIGERVYIGPNVKIGDGCKIQNGVNIYDGVEIGPNVFVGPEVCFTNDLNPRALGEWKITKTFVMGGASIGANSTILCGISIGADSMIGCGSTIAKNVPQGATIKGPAGT